MPLYYNCQFSLMIQMSQAVLIDHDYDEPAPQFSSHTIRQILRNGSRHEINNIGLDRLKEIHLYGQEMSPQYIFRQQNTHKEIFWVNRRLRSVLRQQIKEKNISILHRVNIIYRTRQDIKEIKRRQCKPCYFKKPITKFALLSTLLCLTATILGNIPSESFDSSFNSSYMLVIVAVFLVITTGIIFYKASSHQHKQQQQIDLLEIKTYTKPCAFINRIIAEENAELENFLINIDYQSICQTDLQQILYLQDCFALIPIHKISAQQRFLISELLVSRQINILMSEPDQIDEVIFLLSEIQKACFKELLNLQNQSCNICCFISYDAFLLIFSTLQAVLLTLICVWVKAAPLGQSWNSGSTVFFIVGALIIVLLIQLCVKKCYFDKPNHNHQP